ncbi:aminotransferase class I/II-fold pyridoxal phosphate-dependent enzyme [Bacillus sp. FJAT-42376]|uniref:aminotransferase class I/II-fold pyridoxal phosphate-dependent enzyme n=1 Tax=Bacillus sp. FJAT-42376 TaxID=2014076 RepID=UPI000F50FBBE|nr:aminotransferase class I/II-fold pyridoxal phosphate-dependent enzyme [Bacillus sp. FJAT-42376]AZB44704.1 aminotransferase class I/II-fold pyridoxal phosphate-dependent enzyme [Bacillus sp. FJAT-42376]
MYTPLFSALMKHQEKNPVSFHVPGHKNGGLFPKEAASFYQDLLKLDLTELSGLDDLHDPHGVIEEAQSLAASLYGAEKTFFLVNGSTSGNLAMILACCGEGDTVLVQRNSHKSIMNALELAKAAPVFLSPKIDEALQVPSYVEEEHVAAAIKANPHAKALILTNPSYYGVAADLSSTIRLAHSFNIPVLVDEAHGAHFGAGAPFPESSLAAGADAVVQSAHKTLPAMTMGSYLHINSRLLSLEKTAKMLSMIQTSSPSYPIMASLDLARGYMEKVKVSGKAKEIAEGAKKINEYFDSIEGIRTVRTKDPKAVQDPLKLSIISEKGLTGFELQEQFERHGIYGELADERNFLLVLNFGEMNFRSRSLEQELPQIEGSRRETPPIPFPTLPASGLALSYSEMSGRGTEEIPLNQTEGRVMAEPIIPYPPGIPIILAGERMSEEHLHWIFQLKKSGARFQGKQNGYFQTAAVYKKG